ncbi:MAG: hypothetical protein SH817_01225 [Leptospira sp.]|nr:hypothetical protein [Leptospira sp.]
MKRYLIPIIFFTVGILLQFWLYFSWITLGLLVTSTLLLCLLIFSLSEMSNLPEYVSNEDHDHILKNERPSSLRLPDPVIKGLSEPNINSVNSSQHKYENILEGTDPIVLAHQILKNEKRQRFSEIVKGSAISISNSKISSILYANFDGIGFTESVWQKGNLLIDSEPNEIEWEEFEEINVKKGTPCLSISRQRLFLPLVVNSQILGMICMQTKLTFSESEINALWLSTISLSEKLLEQYEYFRVIHDGRTGLFNKSHFYTTSKDKFTSQETQIMILLKFIKPEHNLEYAICLNQKSKSLGFSDLGFFQIEDQLIACFLPNHNIQDFSLFIQSFVQELEELGYECEIAIGHSGNKTISGKYDQWIKQTFISLESSILSNAA